MVMLSPETVPKLKFAAAAMMLDSAALTVKETTVPRMTTFCPLGARDVIEEDKVKAVLIAVEEPDAVT
jgi:hypothetical protein